jgi:hypothetical protein
VLQHIGKNLDYILTALQQAAPDAEIILLQPYDAYADTQPSSVEVWRQLNRLIGRVAAEHRARVADAFAAFTAPTHLRADLFCDEVICTRPTSAMSFYDWSWSRRSRGSVIPLGQARCPMSQPAARAPAW